MILKRFKGPGKHALITNNCSVWRYANVLSLIVNIKSRLLTFQAPAYLIGSQMSKGVFSDPFSGLLTVQACQTPGRPGLAHRKCASISVPRSAGHVCEWSPSWSGALLFSMWLDRRSGCIWESLLCTYLCSALHHGRLLLLNAQDSTKCSS